MSKKVNIKQNFFPDLYSTVKLLIKEANLFLKITLIVTVPSALYLIMQGTIINSDPGLLTAIASIFLYIALIWTYFNISKAKKKKISAIYKIVSGSILQTFMGLFLIVLISIPAVLVFVLGVVLFVSIPQYWFVFIAPLVFLEFIFTALVTKYSLVYVIIIKEGLSSFKAIARSGRLMRKNTLRLYLTYIVLFGSIAVIYFIIIYLLGLSSKLVENNSIITLVNALVSSISLPVTVVFTCKAYERVLKAES